MMVFCELRINTPATGPFLERPNPTTLPIILERQLFRLFPHTPFARNTIFEVVRASAFVPPATSTGLRHRQRPSGTV